VFGVAVPVLRWGVNGAQVLTDLLDKCIAQFLRLQSGLAGRIYSLQDGTVVSMEIETSYGCGEIRCDNSSTVEYFEGTYSAVSDGVVGVVAHLEAVRQLREGLSEFVMDV
jgi:hypothetical protein